MCVCIYNAIIKAPLPSETPNRVSSVQPQGQHGPGICDAAPRSFSVPWQRSRLGLRVLGLEFRVSGFRAVSTLSNKLKLQHWSGLSWSQGHLGKTPQLVSPISLRVISCQASWTGPIPVRQKKTHPRGKQD